MIMLLPGREEVLLWLSRGSWGPLTPSADLKILGGGNSLVLGPKPEMDCSFFQHLQSLEWDAKGGCRLPGPSRKPQQPESQNSVVVRELD